MSDESASVLTSMAMETVKLNATVSYNLLYGIPFTYSKKKTIYSGQSAEDLDKTLYSHSVSFHPGVRNG